CFGVAVREVSGGGDAAVGRSRGGQREDEEQAQKKHQSVTQPLPDRHLVTHGVSLAFASGGSTVPPASTARRIASRMLFSPKGLRKRPGAPDFSLASMV